MRLIRIRRFPILYWIAAFALAAATTSVVAGLVAEADARVRRWGGVDGVPVATRAVAAGEVVAEADVVRRRMPRAVLGGAGAAADPVGRVATMPIFAGEVFLKDKLAPWGRRGLAALLPPGTRALAIPRGEASPRLDRGDHVDVLATFATSEGDGPPTFPVARAALVLDTTGGAVTIAVTEQEAPRVAFALAQGTVTLALTIL